MGGGDEQPTRREAGYLFAFLLLANFLQYLEAGAVPALLLQLSESFQMSPAEEVGDALIALCRFL
jgi:hypothetical protein